MKTVLKKMNFRFLFWILLLFEFGAQAQVQMGVKPERAGAIQNHEDIRIAEEYYKKEEYAKALVYIEKLQKKIFAPSKCMRLVLIAI